MSLITKSTYLRGPKGNIGLQGPKGERGLQGVQGVPGPAGQPDIQFIRNQISASGNITYNQVTGAIGFTNPGYATTTYVDTAIANLVGNAPAILDTLKEIADAINNDPNFYNNKLSISGGTMTGALILNANPTTNLGAATKQYVDSAVSSFATSLSELSDVAMTGNVVAGQVLKFNGTTWTNDTDNSGIGSVSWNSITGKPVFATVSTTGNYNDLTNKPTIPSFNQSLNTTNNVTFNSVTATSIDVENLEFTGTGPIVISSGNDLKFISAGDITFNEETLSNVAFSGSYADLTNKPTLFDGVYSSLSGKPSLFSGSYTDLTNKPTIPADINQLSDASGLLEAGSTVNIQSYNYDATAGQLIFTGQGENQQALSYTDYDFVQVFKNGILLRNNIQYILNDGGYVDYVAMGDSIELTTPAELNDWIYIIVTSTTTSNPDSITDGGAYADVMEPGLDGGSY